MASDTELDLVGIQTWLQPGAFSSQIQGTEAISSPTGQKPCFLDLELSTAHRVLSKSSHSKIISVSLKAIRQVLLIKAGPVLVTQGLSVISFLVWLEDQFSMKALSMHIFLHAPNDCGRHPPGTQVLPTLRYPDCPSRPKKCEEHFKNCHRVLHFSHYFLSALCFASLRQRISLSLGCGRAKAGNSVTMKTHTSGMQCDQETNFALQCHHRLGKTCCSGQTWHSLAERWH